MHTCQDVLVTDIYTFARNSHLSLPLFLNPIRAGFPSPADDYIDVKLDLNDYLIRHPVATFFMRVEGDSMIEAGIHPGDILIIDRALESRNNRVVVAVVEGEFVVKRLKKVGKDRVCLMPGNPQYQPIEVTPEMNFEIWGVVTHVIHAV